MRETFARVASAKETKRKERAFINNKCVIFLVVRIKRIIPFPFSQRAARAFFLFLGANSAGGPPRSSSSSNLRTKTCIAFASVLRQIPTDQLSSLLTVGVTARRTMSWKPNPTEGREKTPINPFLIVRFELIQRVESPPVQIVRVLAVESERGNDKIVFESRVRRESLSFAFRIESCEIRFHSFIRAFDQ